MYHPQTRAYQRVRHPPPSGWLDEPSRLKGGGVPSPYSNSLKPTIIVTGILVTDRRFDLFQLKANRGDRIATRPKVLARESAIMAPKLAGDGNRTFALDLSLRYIGTRLVGKSHSIEAIHVRYRTCVCT